MKAGAPASRAATKVYSGAYLLIFGALAVANRWLVWLALPPVSIHQWRQADGASIARNYAQNPDFLEVVGGNLFRTGDAHAVGELPLLYWLSGMLTRFAGWPAYPLRWIGLLLLFAGGWSFGWILLQHTRRPLIAALGAGVLLTSPALGYYGPSFLPDAPAFCILLMAMAALFQANRTQSKGWLLVAGLGAALAISLKVSMAIFPLAIFGAWLVEKWRTRHLTSALWHGPWPPAVFAGMAAGVLAFRLWIAQYNARHGAGYFLADTRPVWRYDAPFIRETLFLAAKDGVPAYASAGLYAVACFAAWRLGKDWRKTPSAIRITFLLTMLGSLAYFLLWFRMFREHDYYTICLLILPVSLMWNGGRTALSDFGEKRLVWGLSLCLLAGMAHSHRVLSKRLDLAFHPPTYENLPPEAFLPPGALTAAGIPPGARVLCPQDPSPNISPLALHRQGWTAYNFGKRMTVDTLDRYHTNFGLTHLALRDTASYSSLYRAFFPDKVFERNGWHLYAH